MSQAKSKTKPKRGRPSLYKTEFVAQAKGWCEAGATDQEIAAALSVDVATVYRWKTLHPEFSEALKRGKEVADAIVETSLFRQATGFSHEAVKIFLPAGARKPVIVKYTEHYAPNTTACIFWLKNRKPAEWRDRAAFEVTGADGGPIQTQDVSMLQAARAVAFLLAKATHTSEGKPA